jgi:hypothetical protein
MARKKPSPLRQTLTPEDAVIAGMLRGEGYSLQRVAKALNTSPGVAKAALDSLAVEEAEDEPAALCGGCGGPLEPDDSCKTCFWQAMLDDTNRWFDELWGMPDTIPLVAQEPERPTPAPVSEPEPPAQRAQKRTGGHRAASQRRRP